jgi:septal ring factor EnvC (AmiA/AmiB activator)
MQPSDQTIEILKGIQVYVEQIVGRLDHTNDRIEQVAGHLDRTNERLDIATTQIAHVGERLDETNARLDRLHRRQADAEVRLSTEIVAVVAAVDRLSDVLLEDRALRPS